MEVRQVFQRTKTDCVVCLLFFKNVISVDVECVASGRGHNDRVVSWVAVVNGAGETLYKSMVKPSVPVVSYLTPLTGQQRGDLDSAPTLAEAKARVYALMSPRTLLVGQT